MSRIAAVIVVLALAACAAPSQRPTAAASDTTPVQLLSSSVPAQTVRYDKATGACSAGSVQLLTRERFEELRSGWSLPDGCRGVEKKQVPGVAGYPSRFAKLGRSGSAQVLVRVEADGSVESAHAACATDSAFAQAAEETAKTVSYAPASCDGKPIRSAIFVPFNYDFR